MKLKIAALFVSYLTLALSFIYAVFMRFKYPKLTQTEFLIEYWHVYVLVLLSLITAMLWQSQIDKLKKARRENLPR